MQRSAVVLMIGLLFASGASAVDGAIEINQARAGAGGVTPGDTAGFPVSITAPGSFVLTGNLTAPTNGLPVLAIAMSGPSVAGQHVVIDLHGFVVNNAANPGAPVIAFSASAPQEVVIRNGAIVGGSDGFQASGSARKVVLEDVQVGNSAVNGVHLSNVENAVIRRCVINETGGNGILVDSPSAGGSQQGTIEANLIKATTLSGIVVAANAVGRGSVLLKGNQLDEIGTVGFLTPPYLGAITLLEQEPCLVSENTVRGSKGMGIYGVGLAGCQFIDNVLSDSSGDGIHLDAGSEDNLVIRNTLRGYGGDGVRIAGHKNDIEANVMNSTAPGGVGFGLHFPTGSSGNHYGRNSAVGNIGSVCAFPVSSDFCDDNGPSGSNYSFGDNMMPGPTKF